MRAEIEAYMAACPTCQRVIDHTTAKPGLLKSLLIPMERFICYNMDFFCGLKLWKGVTMMTMVDRATNLVTLIPVHENVTAARAGDLFLKWIVWCYRMSHEVIVHQDPYFMSAFHQKLFMRLGTTLFHSKAYHP